MARDRADILRELDELFVMATGKRGVYDESTRIVEDIGLRSVDILFLVVGIEELFGIRFENVGLSDFETVGSIVNYIEGKLNK